MKNYRGSKNFPDPLAPQEEKQSKSYGLRYAKAIESQWGKKSDSNSIFRRRYDLFEKNRKYANGTQDTNIYKKLLNNLDPNSGDGSLINIDYTPVPILPKFVKIVVNKILARDPYPNLEAIDPLSSSEKDKAKKKLEQQIAAKQELLDFKEQTGIVLDMDPEQLPDSLEESEIFLENNIKSDAEVAAQIATNMTLSWNNFNDSIFRRCVNDLAAIGICAVKRSNDPNYGITTKYIDPKDFIHSQTEDPSFSDLTYAGHVKSMPIQELKRIAGNELNEKDYEEISKKIKGTSSSTSKYDTTLGKTVYDYDEYMVDVLEFEFLSTDCMHYEEKANRHGNSNFFYQGFSYKEKKNSVFERTPHKMEVTNVYKGYHVVGTDKLFGYGRAHNVPKNIHDISKANLSYSVVATNIMDMTPKSMVDSCVGFADMLQLTHLKIQQAIAKAKPDGLIIDIEGLENVQLGKGGELQPLDLHDIYEQTGVFYYRSKNPEGGFQNPPIREVGNSIRNINELIGLYNHYLRMIRDVTGINEVVDASTPKGEALVGVQQQAIAASNNATYDITNSSMILYKKVCSDIVKCLQILPEESVIMDVYRNAVGESNMKVLSGFNDIPMYNFGVQVHKNMEDKDRAFLEQNIQIALSQKEIDLEDAMAIRDLKDINQAERLLITRRKKRIQAQQQMAQQNSQMQSEQAQQASQMAAQMRQQEMQMEAQIESQKMQLKSQLEMQLAQMQHEFNKEIEMIKAQATLGFRTEEQEFKEKLEVLKEDRKDERVEKQAAKQSKLISQRKDQRGELPEPSEAQQSNSMLQSLLTPM
jgi:hypothetical protein